MVNTRNSVVSASVTSDLEFWERRPPFSRRFLKTQDVRETFQLSLTELQILITIGNRSLSQKAIYTRLSEVMPDFEPAAATINLYMLQRKGAVQKHRNSSMFKVTAKGEKSVQKYLSDLKKLEEQ